MDLALIDSTSQTFLGQWKRLVSTTNWDKGRIICQWRAALAESDAPAAEFSDEAWSRRVGQVTPQHVGRLRRVSERFAQTHASYQGLYWSHFQAALDWDDAELWLEGAMQSDWSISEMRSMRFEATGQLASEAAGESPDTTPWDEDAGDEPTAIAAPPDAASQNGHAHAEQDELDEETQFDHEQFEGDSNASHPRGDKPEETDGQDDEPDVIRPFAQLPPLPADLNDAFEAFKLSILRHKLAGWLEITRDDMLAALDSLKALAISG